MARTRLSDKIEAGPEKRMLGAGHHNSSNALFTLKFKIYAHQPCAPDFHISSEGHPLCMESTHGSVVSHKFAAWTHSRCWWSTVLIAINPMNISKL